MGKIYDKEGKRMNVTDICREIQNITTKEQRSIIGVHVRHHVEHNPDITEQAVFAYSVLDSYHQIDSTTEQGARLRKLMDNLMTKYQKSTMNASAEDMAEYKGLIEFFAESD